MSSTRRTTDVNAPLSQGRYMSSPEYVELRGVSGTAAAARVAALKDESDKELVMFLQALSLRPGGIGKIAASIWEAEQKCFGEDSKRALAKRLFTRDAFDGDEARDIFRRSACDFPTDFEPDGFDVEDCQCGLADFLIEFSVNPHAGLDVAALKPVVEALRRFKKQYAVAVDQAFVKTEISKSVFRTLQAGLDTGKPVGVSGNSQIGKTTAAEAFVEMHLGRCRFVSLSGVTNKTSAFRAIARAIGIASGQGRKSTEMQARIEDFLQKTRLMLVIDEAHFLFAQGSRVTTRPELIDWVNTALYNHCVPYALVATPQFFTCLNRVEQQVGWNSDQFKGRMRRWMELPEVASKSDLQAVAAKLFSGAQNEDACVQYVVGYALTSKRYLPAIVHAAEEAGLLAKEAGRNRINYADVKRAVSEYCIPSDQVKSRVIAPTKKARSRVVNAPLTDSRPESPFEDFRSDREVTPMVSA